MLLALESVSKDFDGGRVQALAEINLSLRSGETLAIVGRSGSGKSTLVHLMSGITSPSAGRILWDDDLIGEPEKWTALRRLQIGIVFQDFNLLPTLSAAEGIDVAMFGSGLRRAERHDRRDEVLRAVGLANRAAHLPNQMSGGERQRLAIARSIVNRPRLILADEPTGSLDSVNAKAALSLLFDLCRENKTALILVTHERSYAEYCDRIVEIADGRIV